MATTAFRLSAAIAILGAAAHAGAAQGSAAPARSPGLRPLAELSAGPLIGIDRPFRGGSGELLLGLALAPFEAGIRAGVAYDIALGAGAFRLDAALGLGSGLRAIVGGLVPFGALSLQDPAGASGTRLAVTEGRWPDRFGLAASIAEFPWKAAKARVGIEAELVYTAYRLAAGGAQAPTGALAGAAAFAAAVEAKLALRLRWGRADLDRGF